MAFRMAALIVMVSTAFGAAGCNSSRPIWGNAFGHRDSYDLKGETVEINMLDRQGIIDYANDLHGGKYKDAFKEQLEKYGKLFTEGHDPNLGRVPSRVEAKNGVLAAPALAAAAVGFAIDAVQGELEKEASAYEAQFGRTHYNTNFWQDPATQRKPRWYGFEVVRKTEKHDPSFRLLCLMVPAVYIASENDPSVKDALTEITERLSLAEDALGIATNAREDLRRNAKTDSPSEQEQQEIDAAEARVNAAQAVVDSLNAAREWASGWKNLNVDSRIFAIVPVWFEVQSSKSKVFAHGGRLDSEINISIDATWIDRHQTVHQEQVAQAEFAVKGIDLSDPEDRIHIVDDPGHQIAGWFGGLPVSMQKDSNIVEGNGAFKITALVTESDPTKFKEAVERVAKFVGENRSKIIERIEE